MDEFEIELKNGFIEEATQLLSDAEQCFLTLESSPDDPNITNQLFRLAHNLKGSGKAVGFSDLGDFTHKLESLLLKIKNSEIKINSEIVTLLLHCNDHLQRWLNELKNDLNAKVDSQDLLARIEHAMTAPQEVSVAEAPVNDETLPTNIPDASQFAEETTEIQQVPENQLDEMLEKETARALNFVPQPPAQTVAPANSSQNAKKNTTDESIRVNLSRIENLINFVGEMVILESVLKEQSEQIGVELLRKTVHQLEKVTKEVQDISMGMRMIPLKQTFQKMQRIVRDTSSALGKKVELVIIGEETEVDKTILESISDPLVHLIRNAVDHGVESTESRLEKGKDPTGHVYLRAFHQGSSLIIEVQDDGAGLVADKLRNKAIEKGILSPSQILSEQECYKLIFAPGFSTKTEVTDVSGRGVGMDVVRTNIEGLQGDIQISTEAGKGTKFTIQLPLTLAIVTGMVVKSQKERFVIPLSHVHETVKPAAKDLSYTQGIGTVMNLRGETLPVFRLSQLLARPVETTNLSEMTFVVIRPQGQAFAVALDDILQQTQVVIKQLGTEHKHIKGLTGSAILGDGHPALILDLFELANKYSVKQESKNQSRRLAA